ncbi:transposase family protein [Streptomyces sp. SID12488]|nr:transposase family protein [Streptomyces sp. SID12488]
MGVESVLVRRLRQIPDQRAKRGRRHPLTVVLVLAVCTTLVVGSDSITAIRQWAALSPQNKLATIDARRDPLTGRRLAPASAPPGASSAISTPTPPTRRPADSSRPPRPDTPRHQPSPARRGRLNASSAPRRRPCGDASGPDRTAARGRTRRQGLTGARTENGRIFLVGAVDHVPSYGPWAGTPRSPTSAARASPPAPRSPNSACSDGCSP